MSELNDMTCAELDDVAAELALGVLTGRQRAMAAAHLGECDTCREHVRQLMAVGEQLLELLPPAEPPAGFETRVLSRLGLPVPVQEDPYSRLISGSENSQRRRWPARRGARASTGRPGSGRPGPAGRMRRALATAAVGLAVIAAGLGGWRIGAGTPAASAAGHLTAASLLSATHQDVGDIYFYSGTPRWLYMSVDMGPGQETLQCQVVGTDGRVTTIGSFRLADGYGAWGSPDPGNVGTLRGARLVSSSGAVLATATFPSQ